MSKFHTVEAYLSGGITGTTWMPQVMGVIPFRKSLRGPFGLMGRSSGRESFEDTLSLALSENGGDFQCAEFTSDTEIVIVRRRVDGPGRYTNRVKTIQLSDRFPDIVNRDVFTSDGFNDDE
jgi:hypothetical protein